MRNFPFIIEKHSLKKRKTDSEYGEVKMQSMLIRPKKKSSLSKEPVQLNDINHDMENINIIQQSSSNSKPAVSEEIKNP